MKKILNVITPGDVLMMEFMQPLGISQNKLARNVGAPPSRVQAIKQSMRI